jgi:hypothetical protein
VSAAGNAEQGQGESRDIRALMTYMSELSATLTDWADWATDADAGDTAGYLTVMAEQAEAVAERIAQKIAKASGSELTETEHAEENAGGNGRLDH